MRLTASGGLAVGATVILYDGSPFAPNKDSLIQFVASQK
jgi:acyl-coenzyme A synthetase/AMP-(fatty) acid ligase